MLVLASPVVAQPLPATFEWERVGPADHMRPDSTYRTYGVGFIGDTLVASTAGDGTEMLALTLEADASAERWRDWRVSAGTPAGRAGRLDMLSLTAAEAAGEPGGAAPGEIVTFLSGASFRAGPRETRWQAIPTSGASVPVRGPEDALYGGGFGNGDTSVVRSRDGGRSWEVLSGYTGVYTYALAFAAAVPELPAGGLPEGALVSADAFGLAYIHGSVPGTDGAARVWANVAGLPFRFFSISAVQVGARDGDRAGRFLAAGYVGSANRSRVYASDDGGQTWAEVFEFPAQGGGLRVVTAPDGAAYAYWENNDDKRTLYGSADGGQTWADLGPVGPDPALDWPFGIWQLAFGPDGRLYAGGQPGNGEFPDLGEPGGGVWRTAQPVVSVASEEPTSPGTDEPFGLRISPNPSSGEVSIVVSGRPGGEQVRLAVYDALGRLVRVLHDGIVREVARFALGSGELSPGTYVVRAVAGEVAVTERFTVVE
jgi:hypothetical protein